MHISELFLTVKNAVTARQAAEAYGLRVRQDGMACCPFHGDRNPSMKVDRRYYCFGCGAKGDSIDLAGYLLGLRPKEAALRLAADFGVRVPEADGTVYWRAPVPDRMPDPEGERKKWLIHAWLVLRRYRKLLWEWERDLAPRSAEEDLHPRYCEALRNKDRIDDLMDEMTGCSGDRLVKLKDRCGKEIEEIEKRLGEPDAR